MASGGIPLNFLVEINSVGVRESFSLSKLHTLAITEYNENLPNDRLLQFYDALSVAKGFGYDGVETTFANNYFGVVNKKSSKADLLNIFVWNKQATPATIKGGVVSNLDTLKKVNGAFSITIGGTKKDVTLNLSSANSLTDCATKIQEAIISAGSDGSVTDFQSAKVTYSSHTGGFIVKSGVKGKSSKIDFIGAPTGGTDISNSLGLTKNQGAVIVNGYDALADINDVLNILSENNGNYYVIDFTFLIDDTNTQLKVANFANASNDRFLAVVNTSDSTITSNDKALEALSPYNGLLINYYPTNEALGFVSGLISSVDFSQENGNINIAFNDASKFSELALLTKGELVTLEVNNANAILKFGQMGQSQVWYGMGNIQGTKTNSANVYIANSYLMFSIQYAFANFLNNQSFVGLRGNLNNGLIINIASDVFSRAVISGIVVSGATLTDIEKQVVINNFGTEAETAIKQIENTGYYLKIGNIDIENQTLNLITAYVANKNLKRIIVNNYILGA